MNLQSSFLSAATGLNMADAQPALLFLSAATGLTRQTHSLFCSFCLPPPAERGRQTACFALFVCRHRLDTADAQPVLLFLSAATSLYAADRQPVLLFLSASTGLNMADAQPVLGLLSAAPCSHFTIDAKICFTVSC